MTWQEVSRILDNEIKRNTELRIASQDLDLSNIKRRSDNQTDNTNDTKDTNNGKKTRH